MSEKKPRFRVVRSSSEADEYLAAELNTHSPHTKGWQTKQCDRCPPQPPVPPVPPTRVALGQSGGMFSFPPHFALTRRTLVVGPRFCDYPQELVVSFDDVKYLTQLQILSHQSKIAKRVEIFVTQEGDPDNAAFQRLGYLSLDSNERSGFQARELKSVFVNTPTRLLKLVIHGCHVNKYNLFNQVRVGTAAAAGARLAGSSPVARLAPRRRRWELLLLMRSGSRRTPGAAGAEAGAGR